MVLLRIFSATYIHAYINIEKIVKPGRVLSSYIATRTKETVM